MQGGKDSGADGTTADGGDGDGDGGEPSGPGGPSNTLPEVIGEVDPNAPVDTDLPALPRLYNVQAKAVGDSVTITFQGVAGAEDYRVYALPDNGDIVTDDSGLVAVKNAVYRCAGDHQMPATRVDGDPLQQSEAVRTFVDGQDVRGYRRTLSEATLGHVWVEPGEGRIPVYALGENKPISDNLCYAQRWSASRMKQYTTSETLRDELLAKGFRDDGIVFYVPESKSSATRPILTKLLADAQDPTRLYFTTGAEAKKRDSAQTVFHVLKEPEEHTFPFDASALLFEVRLRRPRRADGRLRQLRARTPPG